jgi:RNA polymerase sigma-70 factor (ECF subfamily)
MSGGARQADDPSRLTHRQERALIARAKQGCERSARALVDAHKDRLFGFVGRVIRDYHDAEEICQDAFLKAFANLETFSAEYRFSTWLFTIGYRLCLNRLRKKQVFAGDLDFSTFAAPQVEGHERLAATEEAELLKRHVWEAVAELTPAQRAAVTLFYREGQSCEEIGQVMQIPTATVKSHLHRARARLKERLEPLVERDWGRLRLLG